MAVPTPVIDKAPAVADVAAIVGSLKEPTIVPKNCEPWKSQESS